MKKLTRLLTLLLISLTGAISGCLDGVDTMDTAEPSDVVDPAVAISSPSASGTFRTTADNVIVSGTASDNVGVTRVTASLNGAPEVDATGLNSWSTSVLSLNNGDNTIIVKATDAAGNDATTQIVVTRDIGAGDTVPPSLAIVSPSNTGTFTTTATSIMISGTASDNVGVSQVDWQLNGGTTTGAVGTTNWSTPVLMLNSGANTIIVTASDAAGNTAAAQIVVTSSGGSQGVLQGIGIIGDSNSDEYRANDNRGGAYAATTLNWVEQLVLYRGLNFGEWATRSEPRRTGYAYNWARSGATASSLLSSGQHTGIAQQVAAGEVTLVFVYIGANDFLRARYLEIYDGTVSGAALTNKISGVIGDITTAVDTVLAAGQVEIVVLNLFDFSIDAAGFFAAFPDPVRRQIVTDAVRSVNAGLAAMAQQRGIAVVDLTAVAADIFSGVDQNGFITVGGELIDTVNRGNEPHHVALNDSSGHAGTVSSGISANGLFIEPVNNSFGTSLVPFSDQEILNAAGITP